MMNKSKSAQNGPDPEIEQAVKRLTQTQLSPLEETMFQAWTKANQIADADAPDHQVDFRKVYRQTGGKVLPPGQLKNTTQRHTDIQSIMQAQEAHDKSSPIQMMMDAKGDGGPDIETGEDTGTY